MLPWRVAQSGRRCEKTLTVDPNVCIIFIIIYGGDDTNK